MRADFLSPPVFPLLGWTLGRLQGTVEFDPVFVQYSFPHSSSR